MNEAYAEIANRLAKWIDAAPLPAESLHDVYHAHVLLCELIRAQGIPSPAVIAELEQELRDERESSFRSHRHGLQLERWADRLASWRAQMSVQPPPAVSPEQGRQQVIAEIVQEMRDCCSPSTFKGRKIEQVGISESVVLSWADRLAVLKGQQ